MTIFFYQGINYGTLNKPSASTCCGGSADCENAGLPIAESSRNIDIEDLATHIEK